MSQKENNYTLTCALAMGARGVPVFPIKPKTKDGFYRDDEHLGRPSQKFPGGNPYSWKAQATADEDRITATWGSHPGANIGMQTGTASGIVEIDIDVDEDKNEDGRETIRNWEREHGALPDTWRTITGRGGNGLFYTIPEGRIFKNAQAGDTIGIDIRGNGGFAVIPPSIHPNGRRYEWECGCSPEEIPIAEADDNVLAFIDYVYSNAAAADQKPDTVTGAQAPTGQTPTGKIKPGGRHRYLISEAARMVAKNANNMTDQQILAVLSDKYDNELDHTGGFSKSKAETMEELAEYVAHCRTLETTVDKGAAVRWYKKVHPGTVPDSIPTDMWPTILDEYQRAQAAGQEAQPEKPETLEEKRKRWGLISFDDFEESAVDWLFMDRIPRGEVVIFAGEGGSGKTGFTCDLISGISNGKKAIFDEAAGVPFTASKGQKVFIFSSEDDNAKVLKPRLKMYKPNYANVFTVDLKEDEKFEKIKFNSPLLGEILEAERPAVCIFDPIQSFIPPEVNMCARNEIRQCLNTLVRYAHKYDVTMIILMHTNKKGSVSGRQRMADSADIWDIARSVFLFGKADRDGLRYVANEKNNYGRQAKTVLFSVDDNDGSVQYKGLTDKKDCDFISDFDTRRATPVKDDAKTLIIDQLNESEGHQITIQELEAVAKAAGITPKTLRNAKESLIKDGRIKPGSTGFGKNKSYFVKLPEQKPLDWDEEI